MNTIHLHILLKFQEIVPHLDFWETAGKFSMKGDWYEIDVVLDREKLKSSMFQIYDLLKSFPNSQDFIAELPQDKDFEHMPHVSGKFRINKKSIDQFSFQGVIDDQGYKQNFEMGWTEDRFWFLIPDEESESYLVEVDIEEGKGRVFIEELCEFWWKEEDSILTGQIFFSELDGLMTPLVEFRMEPREDRKGRKGVLEIKDMGAKFLIEQFDLSWYEQRFDLEGVVNFQGAPMLSLKTHYQSKAIAAFDLVKPTSTKSFQDFMREVQKNPLLQDILGESPGLVVPEDASNLPMRRNRYTSKVPKRFGVKKPAEALLEEPGVLSRSTVTQKTVEINGQSVNLEIRHHDYSGGESKIEILNPEALLEVFPDLAEPSTGLLEPGE